MHGAVVSAGTKVVKLVKKKKKKKDFFERKQIVQMRLEKTHKSCILFLPFLYCTIFHS